MKQSVKKIEEVKSFNEMVLSGIADGIYATDLEKNVTLWSKGAERITGHRAEDAIGKPCRVFLSHTDEDGTPLCGTHRCPLTVMETKKILPQHVITAHKSDGQRILVAVTAAPLIEDGNIVGVVEAFRDATAERELARIKESLTNMLVHDFRNPLTVVGVVLGMLQIKDVKKIDEKVLKIAYEACGELDNMIVNLLEISKMEKGLRLDKGQFSMEALLKEAIEKAKVMANAMGQKFIDEIQPDMPEVFADRNLIKRVIGNLISNAVKFTPQEGKITVSTSLREGMLEIAIVDTGPGIHKQFHELIFDKYWQGKNVPNDVRKGVGLGLAFCKMAIEAHNGRIWVESGTGIGSKFVFTLPLSRSSSLGQ